MLLKSKFSLYTFFADKVTVEEIRNTAQHVVLCDLCNANVIEKFCKTCRVSLCNHCAEEHRSSSSKSHRVVPYIERYNATKYPECRKHAHNDYQSYCEDCDRPLCSACVSMGKHKGHKIAGNLGKSKRKKIKSDLKEFENEIYPFYKKTAQDLKCEKATVEKHYDGLVMALSKYRENWLKKIDAVIQYEKNLLIEKKSKHISSLDKQGKSVAKQMSKLVHHIQDMKKILDTKNDFIAAEYRSKIAKFKRPPLSKTIPILRFVPYKIDENDLRQKFGFHTFSNVTQDEDGYIMTTPVLHEPDVINTVSTGCDERLYGVDCCGDNKIWTTWGKIMSLYNINGKLLQSIQTKTENKVKNIATTKKGYLVYSDPRSKTIYRMKKKNIRRIIKLTGWTPCSVCSTSLDGLLVTMISNDKKQSKVVHYSDSLKEYLTFQFDGNGMPLYSTSSRKHISENRNLDICVADKGSCAVVVVNRTGGLRFKYTGPSPNTSFKPGVIVTDNYGQILTADSHNERIHILDQDGKFLRYIVVQTSDCPFSLSVDIKNRLFLAGEKSGNIMVISYT